MATRKVPVLKRLSLIPETLQEMEEDVVFKQTRQELADHGQSKLSKREHRRREIALTMRNIPSFDTYLRQRGLSMKRETWTVLQVNIGLYCNQACAHCHVESSPKRTEKMSKQTVDACIEFIRRHPAIETLDITGGAPEFHSYFRYMVETVRTMRPSMRIIDRCNLTVLTEPGQEDLVDFLRVHRVHVIASLPCYNPKTVDKQRGKGVFTRSIAALQMLNTAGFGTDDDLALDLVFNPPGIALPPSEAELEADYRVQLRELFGITFSSLIAITNMPIKRFADHLYRTDQLTAYMDVLVSNFNTRTIPSLMCTYTLNVKWDGSLYDCDFNQQLEFGKLGSIHDEAVWDLQDRPISVSSHCFGCTAGNGSSCQGQST